mmetsp:Transcript_77297/g.250102  ORF Transcript_77297/g.250102 Transcript_77297/m.250102 type:complete len:303 (+) Transcript_77297:82-990(+)
MEVRDVQGRCVQLPPMPPPDRARMRAESTGGCMIVLFITVSCVVATRIGTSTLADWLPERLLAAWNGLVGAAAAAALASLLGVLLADPGVLRRSQESCTPVPPEVAERLRAGEPLQAMENVLQEGQTYCVRCLLWRRPRGGRGCCAPAACECFPEAAYRIHHCSTCQRCVEHYDHHCAVLGRCIAGRGFSGTLGYFKVLIAMGHLGGVSALAAFVLALHRTGPAGWWFSVLFGGYSVLVCAGWCVALFLWQLRSCGIHTVWDPPELVNRAAGWKRVQSNGPAGADSDLDVPPVDPVVIGSRR